MQKTFSFHKHLHIASLAGSDSWHNVTIHTLLQHPEKRQPSINAFLGARYSRSADSVTDIAREVSSKNQDPAERLAMIFQNYGHKSVGDMADLFVCIENVPMITAMRLFYRNSVLAGQERSTRYQDFARPAFIRMPETLGSKRLRAKYEEIIRKQLSDYEQLLALTKPALAEHFTIDPEKKQEAGALQARAFDTARYLLPMGLQTSLGFVMSARNWSELIALFGGSKMSVDRVVSELVFDLLTGALPEMRQSGYKTEAEGLIRHTEPSDRQHHTTSKLLEKLKGFFAESSADRRLTRIPATSITISDRASALHSLLRQLQLLAHPLSRDKRFSLTKHLEEVIGAELFTLHNHHHQIGPVAQSGSIVIEGMADFGILKDLNRHRSLERFVPIWHDEVNLEEELDRPMNRQFFVCDYLHLPGMRSLRKLYQNRLSETYELIRDWHVRAKKELTPEEAVEFTKYLLPHAHATAYRFAGSIDDLQYVINLRTRPGGHIAYRSATYAWLKKLADRSAIWQPLLDKLPVVDQASRDQFIDRS